jgi:2-methylaconitate cis-trans-isomerase PrpF
MKYKAVFARGGTSKALIFHLRDLPQDRSKWEALFLSAMGSPDPYGRQLGGMGGGVSSLSKVCIVGPSTRPDADVDYTFVQVQVKDARVDYQGNCGNMSSAIGPFAVDEGLVRVKDGDATVRIHNTNTKKIIHSTFSVAGGTSVEQGELAIPGVAGTGAPVRLDFMEPGGASTGKLLPTGRVTDRVGDVEASLVDAANACVFLDASSLGLTGKELPIELEERPKVLERLAAIRAQGALAMDLPKSNFIPLIAFVSAPQDTRTLSGETIPASAVDLVVRMISNGQPHRALPLTGSLCTAVASAITGSIPARLARRGRSGPMRLGMPSGVITVDAAVSQQNGQWNAARGSFYRTARRLFDGYVYA